MFWGHISNGGSEIADIINRAIYSFHMPMYFMLSGYVLKSDSKPFKEYFKSKFKRILLPTLIVYMSTLPIYFYTLDYSTETIKSVLFTIFYIKGSCAYNSPVWFFFCMFQVLLVAKFLRLAEFSNKKLIIVILFSLFLSYACYALKWEYFNFMGFDKCILALLFVSLGLILRRVNYNEGIVIGIISIGIWIVAGVILNTNVSMYSVKLGNFWLFILSGIFGSLSFFAWCKLLAKYEFVRQYAKWTIFIVCSHCIFLSCFKLISILTGIRGLYVYDICSVIFVILAMITYIPICKYIERRIPILMGK